MSIRYFYIIDTTSQRAAQWHTERQGEDFEWGYFSYYSKTSIIDGIAEGNFSDTEELTHEEFITQVTLGIIPVPSINLEPHYRYFISST